LIDHFNQKENPYWLVDMHAGAGIYDLSGQWAQKKMEYAQGIGNRGRMACGNP